MFVVGFWPQTKYAPINLLIIQPVRRIKPPARPPTRPATYAKVAGSFGRSSVPCGLVRLDPNLDQITQGFATAQGLRPAHEIGGKVPFRCLLGRWCLVELYWGILNFSRLIGWPPVAFGCSAIISPSLRSARHHAIGTAGISSLNLCRLFQAGLTPAARSRSSLVTQVGEVQSRLAPSN